MINTCKAATATGLSLTALLFAASIPVLAHKGATGIVKERMGSMKTIAKAMKKIAPMVRGKATYDAGKVKRSAAAIRRHAQSIPKLFPKGSLKGPSEATSNIWTDWATFEQQAKALAAFAGELEKDASNADGQAKSLFAEIGKTCLSCHKDFRKKKK